MYLPMLPKFKSSKLLQKKFFPHLIKVIKYQKQPNLMNYQRDIPKKQTNPTVILIITFL